MFKKLLLLLLISISLLFSGCIDNPILANSDSYSGKLIYDEPLEPMGQKLTVFGTVNDFEYYKLPMNIYKSNVDDAEKIIIELIDGSNVYYLRDYDGKKTEISEFKSEAIRRIEIYYSDTSVRTVPNNDNKNIPILPLGIYENNPEGAYNFYMGEAYSYFNKGDYERADVYARAATCYKATKEAYTLRADCMNYLGDSKASSYFKNSADKTPLTYADFEKAYTKNMNIPDEAKDYEDLGDKYQKTNPHRAIEYYEKSIEIFDKNPCVWHKLSKCYFVVGDVNKNVNANEMIYKLDPQFYVDFPLIMG